MSNADRISEDLWSSSSGTLQELSLFSVLSLSTKEAFLICIQADPPPSLTILVSSVSTTILFLNNQLGPSTTRVSNSPPSPNTAPSPSTLNLFMALSTLRIPFSLATFSHRKLSSSPPLATLIILASNPTACISCKREICKQGGRIGYCHKNERGTSPNRIATDSTRVR